MNAARGSGRPPWAEAPGPGQESCWDYPRPPACEPSARHVTVRTGGRLVADTRRAFRVLETSHPPTWYVRPEDIDLAGVVPSAAAHTLCEWKGVAEYLDVLAADGSAIRAAAWRYPEPLAGFEPIAGFLGFTARLLECTVDGVAVVPQPGAYYAGWITPDVVGPFKGGPGSRGW